MHPSIAADPFTISVADHELADLKQRLANTRFPNEPDGNDSWDYGTNLSYMERLIEYWRDDYDWRAAEARLNRFDHFRATISGDDLGLPDEDHQIHFIYERGSGKNPRPLILTHGWPSTFAEFEHVIEPLAHPERFGGREEDAFDVIVPSLLGFGFSSKPRSPLGPSAIAELWHCLMTRVLGYDRYCAQAGDWGSYVTSRLALQHGAQLDAIHLTMLPLRPAISGGGEPVTQEEADWIKNMRGWWAQEEGYRVIQGTKPMALAFAVTDSPAGLAGWLADKYYRLGDTEKSHPYEGMDQRFPMDMILTQLSIYWFTGTINSANTLYKAGPMERTDKLKPGERVTVPTAYSEYPMDVLPRTPESWGSRCYDIKRWRFMEKGGHFAALEEPEIFTRDVQDAFRELLGKI